jgi:hypothetical protein
LVFGPWSVEHMTPRRWPKQASPGAGNLRDQSELLARPERNSGDNLWTGPRSLLTWHAPSP